MNELKTPIQKWERWFIAFLFAFALGLRFVYLYQIRDNPFFEHPRVDALFHDRLAQSISAGNILGSEAFFRAPFYPYVLGLVYALFGHDYLIPRIFQHLLGACSVLLIYFLSRRIFDRVTAVVASLIAATYSMLIYFEGELLLESLLVFLFLLWFFTFYRARDRPKISRWIVAGFVFGLICITRPIFLALLPLLFAYQIWVCWKTDGRTKAVRIALALLVSCTLPILPVAVHNYVIGHDFVLIASQGGINFYIGNNPAADGYSSILPGELGRSWESRDQEYVVEKSFGRKPLPSEVSAFWYEKGLQYIRDEPIRSLGLLLRKFYFFWNWFEIPNNQSFYTFKQYSGLLQILPIDFRVVGPLGLLGMVICWKERRGRFLTVFMLLYCIVTILFFVCDRFRMPVVPLLCMLGAFATTSIVQNIKANRPQWLFRNVALLAVMAIFVNSNLYNVSAANTARDQLSLGLVAFNQGDYTNAIEHFKQGSTQGAYPNLNLDWGVAEWMLGKTTEAVMRFHQELFFYPSSYSAMANLSYLYLTTRQLDSCLHYANRATARKPYMPSGYICAAQAYQLRNSSTAAESTLQAGSTMCGENFLYGEYLLAGIHRGKGTIGIAESEYRSILRRLVREGQTRHEPEFEFSEEVVMGESRQRLKGKLLYALGHVFVSRGMLDSCTFYFRAATSTAPDLADPWADLGVALMQSHRLAEADTAMKHALRLDSLNYAYWYNYGTLLGTMRRFAEARGAFEKTLHLRPDFAPAHEKLDLTRRELQ
jgi:4-amino-4-deoxy-L-arabinose transferase-like glycosyltransferase